MIKCCQSKFITKTFGLLILIFIWALLPLHSCFLHKPLAVCNSSRLRYLKFSLWYEHPMLRMYFWRKPLMIICVMSDIIQTWSVWASVNIALQHNRTFTFKHNCTQTKIHTHHTHRGTMKEWRWKDWFCLVTFHTITLRCFENVPSTLQPYICTNIELRSKYVVVSSCLLRCPSDKKIK